MLLYHIILQVSFFAGCSSQLHTSVPDHPAGLSFFAGCSNQLHASVPDHPAGSRHDSPAVLRIFVRYIRTESSSSDLDRGVCCRLLLLSGKSLFHRRHHREVLDPPLFYIPGHSFLFIWKCRSSHLK